MHYQMKAVPLMPEPWPVYAGDDEALEVTVRDENCDRINLEGYEIKAAWRCSPESEDEVQLGVDYSNAADGVLVVYISSEQTAIPDGPIRCGVFDIQTKKDGVTRTILRGDLKWNGDVER